MTRRQTITAKRLLKDHAKLVRANFLEATGDYSLTVLFNDGHQVIFYSLDTIREYLANRGAAAEAADPEKQTRIDGSVEVEIFAQDDDVVPVKRITCRSFEEYRLAWVAAEAVWAAAERRV